MHNEANEKLKAEVANNIGNVSMNFNYFEFVSRSQEEKRYVFKFPFPKYRSFEVDRAFTLYKHISRTINF